MKLATTQKLGGTAMIAGAILFAAYSVLSAALLPLAEMRRDAILRQAPSGMPFRNAMMPTTFGGIVLFCLALVRSTAFPKAGGLLVFTRALLYGLGPALGTYGWLGGVFTLASGCRVLGVALVRPPVAA